METEVHTSCSTCHPYIYINIYASFQILGRLSGHSFYCKCDAINRQVGPIKMCKLLFQPNIVQTQGKIHQQEDMQAGRVHILTKHILQRQHQHTHPKSICPNIVVYSDKESTTDAMSVTGEE